MSMKKIVMVVTLMVFSQMVGAQDVCFSQNHSCQMYLNPSLAGKLSESVALYGRSADNKFML